MKKILNKNTIKSIIKKEFRQVLRDPRMRGILFGSPLLMLMLFGYAVNTDVKSVKLAVLDQDKTHLSRQVIKKFTSSGYFKLHHNILSSKELIPLMDSGKIEVYIHIKEGLSRRVKSGKESEIQIIVDGSDSSRAAVISAYTNEILSNFFMDSYINKIRGAINFRLTSGLSGISLSDGGFTLKKGIELKERVFFNPELSSRNFFLPGVIGLLISLITIMLTSMSIVKERESGTIDQIIVSPIKPLEYILGKTIPFAIVGFIDMTIVSLLAIFWFNVPFNGSFAFLLISSFFFILSTLSVGLLISTISHTQQQAMLSFFLFFVPAMLFSGFVFPVYSMPGPIQIVAYFNPLMYFIVIIRGIFLKGVGIYILWKELLILIVIGAILIYLSTKRLSRRLD